MRDNLGSKIVRFQLLFGFYCGCFLVGVMFLALLGQAIFEHRVSGGLVAYFLIFAFILAATWYRLKNRI